MCRLDPKTYDYLRRPPATNPSRRRKSARPVSAAVDNDPRDRDRDRRTREDRRSVRKEERRGSVKLEKPRPRSWDERSRDERSSFFREEMPHRREKGRAWWEGEGERRRERERELDWEDEVSVEEVDLGGGRRGGGAGRSPRRSSARV